jgi:hypothetical protein
MIANNFNFNETLIVCHKSAVNRREFVLYVHAPTLYIYDILIITYVMFSEIVEQGWVIKCFAITSKIMTVQSYVEFSAVKTMCFRGKN